MEWNALNRADERGLRASRVRVRVRVQWDACRAEQLNVLTLLNTQMELINAK